MSKNIPSKPVLTVPRTIEDKLASADLNASMYSSRELFVILTREAEATKNLDAELVYRRLRKLLCEK